MSRFKLGIIAAFLVVALCLFVGCSADALMRTGKTLGKLGSAGFGNAGDEHVAFAVDSVKGFVERYEDTLDWSAVHRTVDPEGKEHFDDFAFLKFKGGSEGIPSFSNLMSETISAIIKAKETGASDSELRAALDARYEGYADEWFAYKVLGPALDASGIGVLLAVLPGASADAVKNVSMPFITNSGEYQVIINRAINDIAMTHLSDVMSLVTFYRNGGSGGGGGGGESKFKIEDLKYIPERMNEYVGDRTYVTVGDKITACMAIDIVNTVYDVFLRFITEFPCDPDGQGKNFENLNAEWVLGKCGTELDRVMADLEALGYIYDFNLDVAGLAGKILGN
ncbi:MAG: hypothetical protein ILP16_03670 [Spirochaetales bacterium]|nr:hypothetical protein [Spirochaetales bacterium]